MPEQVTRSIQDDVEAVNRIPLIPNILELICRTTNMGFSAVARVTDMKWVACSVRDEINFGLKPGDELQLETTICNEIRQSGEPVIIDHVACDASYANHHTPAMYEFQSYISVPIWLKNGEFFGTLCAIDPKPAMVSTPQVISMFNIFVDLISFHLSANEQLFDQGKKIAAQHLTSIQDAEANRELDDTNRELKLIQGHLEDVIYKLLDSEAKLKQAIDTGRMGTWSINPATYEVTMSPFIREMFGFPQEGEIAMEAIMNAIHPEYHTMLNDVLKNAIERGESSDTEYSITHQITGEIKWVRATGRVFTNAEGVPTEYSGLFMDITERKLDDLRKNDFIGMVSHELKTPLTTLNAYAQVLQAKAAKSHDEFAMNALEKVSTQIRKMSNMINGFLDVSRLESGKILLVKTDFLFNELLLELIREARLTGATHRIDLLNGQPLTVYADKDKIGSVISNLLSNAIKYSPRGEVIEVSYRIEGSEVIVGVKDEGMGIKPEHLDRLFDRFYRVETKHTQYISGFGIGLYLSAEIVQRHGGRIWAESQIGKGSTFYFSLPL